MMINQSSFKITQNAIDEGLERELFSVPKAFGGYLAFIGVIRDFNHGKVVTAIEYQAYEELCQTEWHHILHEVTLLTKSDFSAQVVHRVGKLAVGDKAVMLQVACPHRAEAFMICRFLIDQLKERVPIWKKEHYDNGQTEWIACNHNPHHR